MATFQITLRSDGGPDFVVIAEHTRDGAIAPYRKVGRFTFDEQQLLALDGDPAGYGTALGQRLFQGDTARSVGTLFADALDEGADDRLRVLLYVEAEGLQHLRWERLCAPFDEVWMPLATSQRAPLSRYIPSLTDRSFPPTAFGDLRALLVAASPAGLPDFKLDRFDEDAALAGVRRALGSVPHTVLATEGGDGPPTLDEICRRLTVEHYPLLHIVCHGRMLPEGEGVIYLAHSRKPGEVHPVTCSHLIKELSAINGPRGLPQFVFLAVCESAIPAAAGSMGSIAHRLVGELGLPAIVAMSDRISVETANALAEATYERLRVHGEPDLALVEATAGLSDRPDITVPGLFSRLGGRRLFSDAVEGPLAPGQIARGLDALAGYVKERAPVLSPELRRHELALRIAAPEHLGDEARAAYAEGLRAVEQICVEATDLTFTALAQGARPADYDSRCPFPGLAPFAERDKDFFFERERLVETLLARLAASPLLTVTGESGVGKSSLVHAGLIPALRERHPGLRVAKMTPGEMPLANLEFALFEEQRAAEAIEPAPEIIVVVDQFEELFTITTDKEERQAFAERLEQLAATHRVIVTLRSDFEDEWARYPALSRLMGDGLARCQVGPMDGRQLRAAMERQAAEVGLRFEAGLSGAILAAVEGEPLAMPLLQHSLHELWERRRGRWLREKEYAAIGGVKEAIATTAEEIYNTSAPEEQARLRDIFVRLTRLDPAGEGQQPRDTRQAVPLRALVPAGGDEAATRSLVSRLIERRLVTPSPVTRGREHEPLEIGHEALIRHWARLQGWLREDRTTLLQLAEIGRRAHDWHERGRPEGPLLREGELDDALALARRPRYALNSLEQEFISASETLRRREAETRELERQLDLQQARDLAEERQKSILQLKTAQAAQRWLTRFLAAVALFALAAMAAAIAGGWAAASQQGRAEAARDEAEQRRVEAEAARGEAEQRRVEAEAAEVQARANLLEALEERFIAQAQAHIGDGRIEDALAAALVAQRVDPVSSEAQRVLALAAEAPAARRLLRSGSPAFAGALSPDGRLAASGDAQGVVTLWDLERGDRARSYGEPGPGRTVWDLAFTPDGAAVIAGRADGSLTRYSLASEQPFASSDAGPIFSLALSPDGALLAAAHPSGVVSLWDVATGRELPGRFRGHTGAVFGVAISPDGSLLLTGGEDGTVRLWSMTDRAQLLVFGDEEPAGTAHIAPVNSVAFSADGALAASASDDSTIGLWDVAARSPTALVFLDKHAGEVYDVAFDPTGGRMLSVGSDGVVLLWELDAGGVSQRLVGHTSPIYQVAFSGDGARALSASRDATIRLWDLRSSSERAVLRGHEDTIYGLALTAAGDRAASASYDGTVRLWELDGPRELRAFTPHDGRGVPSVALSPDGAFAISGDTGGEIAVWSTDSGLITGRFSGHRGAVVGLALSADGDRLLSAATDGTVRLWEVATRRELRRLSLEEGVTLHRAILSADGRRALIGLGESTAQIWDLTSGEISAEFREHVEQVEAVALSPDGLYAATGAKDGTIWLWDPATGKPIRPMRGHTGGVTSLAFSPDGGLLVSGSLDRTIRVWSVDGGTEMRRLTGHSSAIYNLAVPPDGRSIVSASRDASVRLWALSRLSELITFVKAERYVRLPPLEQRRRLEAETGLDLYDD